MPLLSEAQQAYLSNPFYSALTTAQSAFGEHVGGALRYRPEILPFTTVATPETKIDPVQLRRDTDTNFIGVIPRMAAEMPDAIHAVCVQMAWQPRKHFTTPAPLLNECELGAAESHEMVELTQAAFPGYFRAETYRLGRYIGIRENGQLVAMAGHRTRMPGLREISGVCTRPGHTGKGYAQHLIQRLLADGSGDLPYLHSVSTNARAIAIYKALCFVTTGEVDFLKLSQQP
ncbi:GNAT family N-acetyltransferase [Terriglobus roseus]|uniref:FR47-like protein n=1 Tax=Terriglobus roseus TaxID=392734 RepID=A0A1G7G7A9_9BACT|nr:GNAT family N-acetyltransferase [Terriglobus roseus]SDE83993.1 FR47-like protein [Terriglobus roseus]